MNSEKILNILEKIEVKENSKTEFEDLKRELQADILTGGKINKGLLATFKKYVKENEKAGKEKFMKIYKTKNGHYCVTNGYFLIDFGTDINNINKNIRSYVDENIMADSSLDFENLSDKFATKIKELNIIDLEKNMKYNEIRQKELKEKNILPLPFQIDETFVNASFFINVLKIIDKKVDKITVNYNTAISPIQFKIDDISILILPIRLNSENLETVKKEKENFDKLMK